MKTIGNFKLDKRPSLSLINEEYRNDLLFGNKLEENGYMIEISVGGINIYFFYIKNRTNGIYMKLV
jgi:hypothetical protein